MDIRKFIVRKFSLLVLMIVLLLISSASSYSQNNNRFNRSPLKTNSYSLLLLGSIKPEGWIKEQLIRMKNGLTGHLDERYAQVAGKRNAWLGGDGDAWERGPYWIDGLLPLAYILNDKELIAKVQPWIEWTLNNQREDGYIGPGILKEKPTNEPGIQKEPREDWWPRMVMLKILQQYYEATQDKRVITVLTKYFKYQLKELPSKPLDNWSFWGNRRGADNLMVVYWLYNITGDVFLLDLGDLIYKQTFPFKDVFLNPFTKQEGVAHLFPYNVGNKYPYKKELIDKLHVGQMQSFHCVNLAQGIKTPVIYYQRDPKEEYIKAVKQAFNDIAIFHGQAQGMYGGDEPIHGNNPTQGIEFCSVVEMMFSLESMLAITGDNDFADHLEKLAFNALPTQATDDFSQRQYFQSANQVLISRAKRNFFEDDGHGGTDLCFGLLTGYPCCTSNMHQGWPKFVQNLWYATPGNGLAALVYAPNEVTTKVGNGIPVTIKEETNYPFNENIKFTIQAKQSVSFPLYLRIPKWASNAELWINGEKTSKSFAAGSTAILQQTWKNGDEIVLKLPMKVSVSRWAESSAAVERGPLVYALRIEEDWKKVNNTDHFGEYFEVYPKSDWNYGLLSSAINNPEQFFEVVINNNAAAYPWNLENAPVSLKTKAKKLSDWKMYNNMPGPLPHNFSSTDAKESSDIILVPYGCSTLRISQFPVVN